jgi:two-component system, cell cycle response regulator DivK
MTNKKILLVEDNEQNWNMLSRRLERRGFDVVVATDGQEAVRRHEADSPDLILMDISLPVMDGLEATRQIRAAATGANVPIIALTAHAMASDREKSFEAGCDEYHTKPVDLPKLLEQIDTLLKGPDPAG